MIPIARIHESRNQGLEVEMISTITPSYTLAQLMLPVSMILCFAGFES